MHLGCKPPLRWWELALIFTGTIVALSWGLPAYLSFCAWAGPLVDKAIVTWGHR